MEGLIVMGPNDWPDTLLQARGQQISLDIRGETLTGFLVSSQYDLIRDAYHLKAMLDADSSDRSGIHVVTIRVHGLSPS